MNTKEYSIEIGGKPLKVEFSDLADQTNGSVIMRYGNTVVLATVVMSPEKREGLDYFPLTVDYEEKFYAAGAILGSQYMRREGKPSDEAILSGRAVDRTIRPLFDHRMRNEVQIIVTILSIDEDDPDVVAINAASLALLTSDIPWNGPVSAVRLGKDDGDNWIVNPSYKARNGDGAKLDLLVCGKDGKINMLEIGAHEMPETTIGEGFEKALLEIEALQNFQKQIRDELGKEKQKVEFDELSGEVVALFEKEIAPRIEGAIFQGTPGKKGIGELHSEWEKVLLDKASELGITSTGRALEYFENKIDESLHRGVIEKGTRPDGRGFDEVRPLFAKAGGISPILHGCGIFYRGGTHVLSALTLGGPSEAQSIEGIEIKEKKRFIHHYNFPPFSSGETGRIGNTNRRMIGHGALAEKALKPVIPSTEKFPYTIRVVSEALASNGSTSMASVCGGTLALMDGGVPITSPVAGIAIGLFMDPQDESKYKIATDIQGPEDHHGDMDFKVAGTRNGITALQMDVKVLGIPTHILLEALEKAKLARHHILDVIEKEISSPREKLSPNAPEILSIKVKKDQIGLVIGGGGKTINGIKDLTLTEIDIEEDGTIFITGKNGGAQKARKMIEDLTHEYVAGEKAVGIVERILDFGAFVKIGPDAEGLVHISELAPFRVSKVTDVLEVGEEIPVVVKEIDERGRINLSLKGADPEFATRKGVTPSTEPVTAPRERRPYGGPRSTGRERRE